MLLCEGFYIIEACHSLFRFFKRVIKFRNCIKHTKVIDKFSCFVWKLWQPTKPMTPQRTITKTGKFCGRVSLPPNLPKKPANAEKCFFFIGAPARRQFFQCRLTLPKRVHTSWLNILHVCVLKGRKIQTNTTNSSGVLLCCCGEEKQGKLI